MRQRVIPTAAAAVFIAGAAASAALAQTAPGTAHVVQVTATRFGEPLHDVPGSIGIVTGEELRARGALDLRTALSLLAGVTVGPGGDAGPAAAAPGLLGQREVDDLLLLIDGIPAGGAYMPQVEAVSLVNVERIEVLRGQAPVYFGTTAFAGTINVIHYPAGRGDPTLSVRVGSRGSVGASGAVVLSAEGVRQSLSGELGRDKSPDARTRHDRAQGHWRLATELDGSQLRADVHLLALRQLPGSPAPVDEATGRFGTLLPVGFNQNPADAKLDTDRGQLVLGHDTPLSFARWSSTLSYTNAKTRSIRGAIDAGDTPQPWTAATVADLEAFRQTLKLSDLFVDSHLSARVAPGVDLTGGFNVLLGRARAHSLRHALKLQLDGQSQTPAIDSVASKGTVDLDDDRRFIGVYMQARWQPVADFSVLAGLRWNDTHEEQRMTRVNRAGVATVTSGTQDLGRASGSLGAQWKAWKSPQGPQGSLDALTLHASVGNTFQPAQVDFNPAPEPGPDGGGILKPETQRSVILGLKGDAFGGMAEFDIDAFFVDFSNQPVQGSNASNVAVLRAQGRQRYRGLELEGAIRPAAGWTVRGQVTWSDARYRDFLTDVDGTPTQLSGKRQVLVPRLRVGGGLVYAAARGWNGSLTAVHNGARWLDRLNTVQAPAYTVVDASLGYRFEGFALTLAGRNLGNRRDAVLASELGEDQFYRVDARRVDLTLAVPFN